MKIKRNTLLEDSRLFIYLSNIMTMNKIKGVKMRYFLSKNNGEGNTIFGPELKAINDAGMSDFEKKRIELLKEFAEKDDKGNMITLENGQADIKNMEGFAKAYEEMRKSFDELWKFVEGDTEITPHKISIDDIPDEVVEDQPTMDRLTKYINEST